LRERCHGDLEGRSGEEQECIKSQGGESLAAFMNRVGSFLDALIQNIKIDSVLIVSHGGTICAIVSLLLGVEYDSLYKMGDIPNGSITIFDPVPFLKAFSKTEHLLCRE
jgi:broad specificity phosphatase PhoE